MYLVYVLQNLSSLLIPSPMFGVIYYDMIYPLCAEESHDYIMSTLCIIERCSSFYDPLSYIHVVIYKTNYNFHCNVDSYNTARFNPKIELKIWNVQINLFIEK